MKVADFGFSLYERRSDGTTTPMAVEGNFAFFVCLFCFYQTKLNMTLSEYAQCLSNKILWGFRAIFTIVFLPFGLEVLCQRVWVKVNVKYICLLLYLLVLTGKNLTFERHSPNTFLF